MFVLLAIVAIASTIYATRSEFHVVALLRVRPHSPTVNPSGMDYRNQQKWVADVLLSRSVLETALKNAKLKPRSTEFIQSRLEARHLGSTEVVSVMLRGRRFRDRPDDFDAILEELLKVAIKKSTDMKIDVVVVQSPALQP